MMKDRIFLLAAGIMLAMAFTYSCSSDNNDGPSGDVSSSSETANEVSSSSSEDLNSSSSETLSSSSNSSDSSSSSQSIDTGDFSDPRDNNVYKMVKIGEQIWMAENLNFEEGGLCYANDPDNCEIYGRLYNWETAMNVCPIGWHLPSGEEWDQLLHYVDGIDDDSSPYDSPSAGKYLKSADGWKDEGNGEDTYSFAALPGGFCDGYCDGIGRGGRWWSTAQTSNTKAYRWSMDSSGEHSYFSNYGKEYFFSVRCIKDN
jgi:uncharacterized protein (TIGR02145 family)